MPCFFCAFLFLPPAVARKEWQLASAFFRSLGEVDENIRALLELKNDANFSRDAISLFSCIPIRGRSQRAESGELGTQPCFWLLERDLFELSCVGIREE